MHTRARACSRARVREERGKRKGHRLHAGAAVDVCYDGGGVYGVDPVATTAACVSCL